MMSNPYASYPRPHWTVREGELMLVAGRKWLGTVWDDQFSVVNGVRGFGGDIERMKREVERALTIPAEGT